jgi:hypothetical protein
MLVLREDVHGYGFGKISVSIPIEDCIDEKLAMQLGMFY